MEEVNLENMIEWFGITYDFHLTDIEAGLVSILLQNLTMAYRDLIWYKVKLDTVGMFILAVPFDSIE